MSTVLGDALRNVAKVAIAGILTLAISVTAAPDLVSAAGVLEVGLLALGVAILTALAPVVPLISIARFLPDPYGKYADAFLHGAVAALVTSLIGILNTPDLSTWHSLGVAALVGAFNVGLHAILDIFTGGKEPLPGFGVGKK